jgi:hypothetical protein
LAEQLLFDMLAYIDCLKRADFRENQARALAEAMHEAMREESALEPRVRLCRVEPIAVAIF